MGDVGRRARLAVLLLLFAFLGPDRVTVAGPSSDDTVLGDAGEAEQLSISFVTLRNKTDSSVPADVFGGDRGSLRAGRCTVSFKPLWGLGEIAAAAPIYVPDEKITLAALDDVELEQFYREIETAGRRRDGPIVVYLHGYNIDFAKSCRRSAIFQRSLGNEARLALFSWPAEGNLLTYTWDEADLSWSVSYIASFLEEVVRRAGRGRVDVVAHSLGARGAYQALIRMAYRQQEEPIIGNFVMIAPDIDSETFRLDYPLVTRVARRITLYASENDKALKLSEEVHGYPRLGQAGDNLTVIEGMETIDISMAGTRRLSGHLYHLFNPAVIADLTNLLHTGAPAARRSGLVAAKIQGRTFWRLLPPEE